MIMALKWLQRRIDLIQSTNPKSFVIMTRKEDPYSVFSSDSAETKDHYLILLWGIKTCKILSNWSINFELRSILLELKTQNGSLLVQIWLLGPPNCHDRLVWTELWGESFHCNANLDPQTLFSGKYTTPVLNEYLTLSPPLDHLVCGRILEHDLKSTHDRYFY